MMIERSAHRPVSFELASYMLSPKPNRIKEYMPDRSESSAPISAHGRGGRLRNRLVVLILASETLALAVVLVLLLGLGGNGDSVKTTVALIVLAVLATAWVGATTVGFARRSGWARSSAVTWQVLQFAIAVGAVQGATANWIFALALGVPAVAAVLLSLSPSARADYQHASRDADPV